MARMNERKTLAEILRRLREERKDSVAAIQSKLKEHNTLRKRIRNQLSKGPQTIPVLAEAISSTTDEVLWHIMAMRKYGEVAEDEQEGDYFKYHLTEKKG